MKPNELTKEAYRKLLIADLVKSYKYTPEKAAALLDEYPDVVDEGYKGTTDEQCYIKTHRAGDSEGLADFREGKYILSSIGGTAMCLDMLA